MNRLTTLLDYAASGRRLSASQAIELTECDDLPALKSLAAALRDRGHGARVSYSRKVFIPLTQLCRDSCHYCTFAQRPRPGRNAYLTLDEVLTVARLGGAAGCHEALFTLGDKPELRYRAAADELKGLGHESTISYLAEAAALVLNETGLLPHLNAGVMTAAELSLLRGVSASQGLMLETASERLAQRGGPHYGSPDKLPAARLETIRAAGEAAIPFTSGILIGIGETRRERVEALLQLRDLSDRYAHLQEIIIQNFRAKPHTRMARAPEPAISEHVWTIAVARILFGAEANIQAPPNLRDGALADLLAAGINDWGGVSPITPDHVNPERPWPAVDVLARQTAEAGKVLVERLALYPKYALERSKWTDGGLRGRVLQGMDAEGLARTDRWRAGASGVPPSIGATGPRPGLLTATLTRAARGEELSETEIAQLFAARGESFHELRRTADAVRRDSVGSAVSYVVTRNINYTNVCSFACKFCAFSKGKLSDKLRARPYDLDLDEIVRRCREAWQRGAVEVCLQGGIHPSYTGETYLAICRAIKQALPSLHIHAFSPLEIWQGAGTLGISLSEYLAALKAAGLGSLPGTAAEILHDEVRAVICPDKVNTRQWLEVVETAHRLGLRTTSTIMYGHVDSPRHWAQHLLQLRRLQSRTGGITEFVPLPFVAMEAPIYLKGMSRPGPTYREAVLMHAVARLVLHPLIRNIQTSWVKMGPDGAVDCLNAGANDLGGTLMNESITRAAGATHGEEMPPERMEMLIRSAGSVPWQRTTLYGAAPGSRIAQSFSAPALEVTVNTPLLAARKRHSPSNTHAFGGV